MTDSIAALIYLKNKVHKWRNITLIFVVISALLSLRLIFDGVLSSYLVEGDVIASVKIEGAIFKNDFRSEVLEEIAQDNSVKAVIVNIDSPGGEIVSSEILFENLRDIASKKPTVAVMGSVAASGAYMAAIATDYIIAHNGTLTGSIGVLMESPEFVGLANKLGVKFKSYKSSPLKGSPSPFEKTSPAVDKAVNESIQDSYQFFVDLVLSRREDKLNDPMVFDGRAFTGRQALDLGLIDQIGGKKEALSYLKSRKIKIDKLPIKNFELTKKEEKIFAKFLNILPFFDGEKANNYGNKLMAILH